ncbi:Slam-dependent surface lipoprotein [Kerstersia gyiorum]|uniref:Slam-dependent surface lipoprotein n=1 Tax=Kerstersia gyiorum TaxID=206506 RepID=UPI0039E89B79
MMSKTILSVVLLGAFVPAHAAVTGGTSNAANVAPQASTALPFGANKPGLSLNGSSLVINLKDGPIHHIAKKYSNTPINSSLSASVDGLANPKYLTLKDVNAVAGLFTNPTLGQIWYEQRSPNEAVAGQQTAIFGVYSIRQIANPALPAAPKFGGLVIAEVPNLPAGTAVYFGEWGPRAGNPSTGSDTNLNLNTAEHTVWYVGENATGSTKHLSTASYAVLGVNQHVPGQNDFFQGQLDATFGNQAEGSLNGALTRVSNSSDVVAFDNVTINNNDGTFFKDAAGNRIISGQFFGPNADALAGYATRGTSNPADDVAFGGNRVQ